MRRQRGGHVAAHGRPVPVEPMKPMLKAPENERSKLTFDGLLSSFAFKFNLRRYTTAFPFVVTYNVKDRGKPQLAAREVRRRVIVLNPCAGTAADGGDEILCENSGKCSTNRNCLELDKVRRCRLILSNLR